MNARRLESARKLSFAQSRRYDLERQVCLVRGDEAGFQRATRFGRSWGDRHARLCRAIRATRAPPVTAAA